jgi:hypothetical protein
VILVGHVGTIDARQTGGRAGGTMFRRL